MDARFPVVEQISRRPVQRGRLDVSANSTVKNNVGALIYSKKTHRYLFLLRNGRKYAGVWGLAGGKIEHGERVIEALQREIVEELSVNLGANKIIPIETFTSVDQDFQYHTFLITVEDEFVPVLNGEHRGYCWVNLDDYPRPLHPGIWRTFKFATVIAKIKTLEQIL
jgi:8-oxo-dGTP pyrophosphatase MutT (NUDIX family)